MFIKIAQAGVISEAPSINEIILGLLNMILTFIGGLTILMIIISGIIYMTSAGNQTQTDLAKKTFIGSIIGLVIALMSLAIVKIVVGLI
jgi:lysylphosphatidylglycerol synthetase-like protein (DUF2156 family)